MKKTVIGFLLIMSFFSVNLFSNKTLLKDYFRTNTHIINRDTLVHYDGYGPSYYPYILHNFDFLSYYENGEWNNMTVGLFDIYRGRLAFASKDMGFFSNQVIERMQKVCSDNQKYIYLIRNCYNPIKIYRAIFSNGNQKKFIMCDSFISDIFPKPLDIAIKFGDINDLADDEIWGGTSNRIMLLKYDTKNGSLVEKRYWHGIGGNMYEKYTAMAIGNEYGVQNNYVYAYDSLNNKLLELESGYDNSGNPTLSLVNSRTMPSGWIIKSISTDYFGTVWVAEYNNGFLQSYTPDLQQALTTANWSFRANKPVSFTMAMDKPYGILTELWTDTTGVRLYKLGTEIFYPDARQTDNQHTLIHFHFRVTVGSYMTMSAGGHVFSNGEFYLPGEYDRYFDVRNLAWNSGNKGWSITAESACQNPDGSATATVVKTGDFYYSKPHFEEVHLSGYIDNESGRATAPLAHLSWTITLPQDCSIDHFEVLKDGVLKATLGNSVYDWTDNVGYSDYESHTYEVTGVLNHLGETYRANSNYLDLEYIPNSGCPELMREIDGQYKRINTILRPGNKNLTDKFLFDLPKRNEELKKVSIKEGTDNNKMVKLAISENESEKDFIDKLSLISINYNGDYGCATNEKGEIYFYKDIIAPDSCINEKEENITSRIMKKDSTVYTANEGDTLYLYFNKHEKGKMSRFSIRGGEGLLTIAGGKPKDELKRGNEFSYSIETEQGKGWINWDNVWSRKYLSDHISKLGETPNILRIVVKYKTDFDCIGLVNLEMPHFSITPVKTNGFELRNKNVSGLLGKTDGKYVKLEKGDTLYFNFKQKESGHENQKYVLIFDGYYVETETRIISENKNDGKKRENIVYLDRKGIKYKSYDLFDITGRKLRSAKIRNNSISIKNIPAGVYFIKLKAENRMDIRKIEIIR